MKFVVFLDVDGVLNTKTTVQKTPGGYRGIDDARVKILAEVLKGYKNWGLVLSSDWKEMAPEEEDYQYLVSKLEKYGLQLTGKTKDEWQYRGAGIKKYLEEHPEIEEYVILDDNLFDFKEYPELWERFLQTRGIERAQTVSKTPVVETMLFLDDIKKVSKKVIAEM